MSHFNKSIIINGYDNDNALALAIGFTGVCFLNGSKNFVAKYTITVVLNLILSLFLVFSSPPESSQYLGPTTSTTT